LSNKRTAAFLRECHDFLRKNVINLKYFALIKCYLHRQDGGQHHTSPGTWLSSSNSALHQMEPDPYNSTKTKSLTSLMASALKKDVTISTVFAGKIIFCTTANLRLCISGRTLPSW
jgi:hypothetical protein